MVPLSFYNPEVKKLSVTKIIVAIRDNFDAFLLMKSVSGIS